MFLDGGAVRADHTVAAAKVSFDRYHPRIVGAVDTMKKIGQVVKASDKTAAAELVKDKYFQVKARRAMSIYATSFSDNYLGGQSRLMLKCIDRMYSELDLLATGDDMTLHYAEAVKALKKYYEEARLPKAEVASL